MYSGSIEEFIKQYTPYIYRLCSKTYVNGYTMDDLYQQCCLAVAIAANKFDPSRIPNDKNYTEKSYFAGYAISAIRKTLFDKIDKSVNENKRILFNETFLDLSEDENEDIEGDYVIKFTNSKLREAIISLPLDEKELIYSVFINGETYTSYSKRKNIPYPTLMYKKRGAFRKIKSYLKSKYNITNINDLL